MYYLFKYYASLYIDAFIFDNIGMSFGPQIVDLGFENGGSNEIYASEGSEQPSDIEGSDSILAPPSEHSAIFLGSSNYIDSIIFSIIVASIAVVTYYIVRIFINKYADSLSLDRRQLAGVNSITKMIIIVISIMILIFHFSYKHNFYFFY